MTRSCLRNRTFALFGGILVLLFAGTLESDTQDRALTTFSGQVVDEAGNPIAGLTIGLVSVFDGNGAWFPVYEDQHGSPIDPPTFQAETDSEGHFIISNTIAGPVLLTLLPSSEVDVQLLKAQIAGLFFYASGTWKRGIVFAVEQGEDIGNLEITVQYPHIRGKVQRANGAPIAKERIKFRLRTVSLHSESSQSSGFNTDAEGYFRYYVDSGIEEPTFYVLSVTYAGQTVNANPIVLKSGDPTRDMIFTFDSPSVTPFPTHPQDVSASASASVGGSSALDVWVIRPENWHAYKMIKRERWESAQAQAAAEGAYLVAINDAAEQEWLQSVFGGQPSWIGLNDIAKEGLWRWDTGEPVTYENWVPDDFFSEASDVSGRDYAVMTFFDGKWYAVNPDSAILYITGMALLEKVIKSEK